MGATVDGVSGYPSSHRSVTKKSFTSSKHRKSISIEISERGKSSDHKNQNRTVGSFGNYSYN